MTRQARHVAPDGWLATIMLAFLASAGLTYVNLMTPLIDGFEKALKFSPQQAGLIAAINVYGAAAGAAMAATLLPRLNWRRVAWALLAALLGCDLASCMTQDALALEGIRAVDGLAGGFLVATGFSVIARTAKPDRVFGMLLLVQFTFAGLGNRLLPGYSPVLGMPVIFGAMMAFTAVTACMLLFLAPYPPRAPAALLAARGKLPLGLLVAVFLFQFANMGLAAHIIRLGEHAGLARDVISKIIGTAAVIGIVGSGIVMALPARLGRARPLLAGFTVNLLAIGIFLFAANPALFAAANIASAITWTMVIPYLFGLSSAADPTGRAASWASFSSKLGLASGPLAAGWLLSGDGINSLLLISVLVMLGSAAVALPLAFRSERRSAMMPAQAEEAHA